MKRPSVVVVTRRTIRKGKYIDYVGEFHLALLIRVGLLPVMVPVVEGTAACVGDYMADMSGLLLVEGEDVHPDNFDSRAENYAHLEDTHPLKDAVEIRLVRAALRRRLPILGICRGAQLLNAVCGGTLYGDVRKEKKSRLNNIDYAHYDTYRHAVSLEPDTPLEKWYGRREVRVNSYHHQGIRDLAPRFRPMAHDGDGLVEGYYDPKAAFLMGLQFHPERMLEEAAANFRIWQAFGAAIKRR